MEKEYYSMDSNDIENSLFYFDDYNSILDFIKQKKHEPLSIIDFKLKIPLLKDWEEFNIERVVFYLEKLKLLNIDKVSNYPIRVYKFEVNEKNQIGFIKLTENKVLLNINYSEEQYKELILRIKSKVINNASEEFFDHFSINLLEKYSKSEREKELIKERDKQLLEYESSKNLLLFYDISDINKLAEQLYHSEKTIFKIPINPNLFLKDFFDSLQHLEFALETRFRQWYKIQILNGLIDSERREIEENGNPQIAFDRLRIYGGKEYFEILKRMFLQKNPQLGERIINEEINEIEGFIKETQSLKLKDAKEKNHLGNLIKNNPNDYHYEYLRIKGEKSEKDNDYYQKNRCDYSSWSLASRTYGKYVMYYEWLKGLMEKPLPVKVLLENANSISKREETNKVVKKRTTKEKYDIKLYAICDLVENEWRKEIDKTIEQLEKIYKKVKGEYAISKEIDRSQLNTELKNTAGFEYIKIKLMNLYREKK